VRRITPSVLGLALLPFAQATFATVGVPVLVPPHPVAGQLVQISVGAGGCDAFSAYPPTTVTLTGNNIRIDLSAVSTINPTCFLPFGDYVFPVGSFEPGNYSLQVDRTYLGGSGLTTETLAIIPFGVAAIATIPALDLPGTLLLIILLLGVSVRTRRRRDFAESADRF